MYERMLNKEIVPTENIIKEYIGENVLKNMNSIKNALEKTFKINTELKFPMERNMVGDIELVMKKISLFLIFSLKREV